MRRAFGSAETQAQFTVSETEADNYLARFCFTFPAGRARDERSQPMFRDRPRMSLRGGQDIREPPRTLLGIPEAIVTLYRHPEAA